jgi:hypothetical protein
MSSRKRILKPRREDRDKPTRVRPVIYEEMHFDELDCCGLLRAGRGQCFQGIVALNLGLEPIAKEIFKS